MPRLITRVVLLAALLLGLGALPSTADMIITLKDGSVIRVPVRAEDVQSLTFEDGTSEPDAAAGEQTPDPLVAEEASEPKQAAAPGRQALVPPVPPATRSLRAAPIQVGPDRKYKVPSQAARVARDGDVIEIDAGEYVGDVAHWRQNNLTIRGVGGRAHIDAQGNSSGGKAIWVISGDNVTVENVELSGCTVPDLNGAGIRLEGTNFTLRNSYIHDNQMGLLSSGNRESRILIENSEFARNVVNYEATGSLGHNIYIGRVRSFTLRGSYVHQASIGHNVKTRAAENYIIANRIMDGTDGNSSYLIDLAQGGDAYVLGNLLHKSASADNYTMIGYATEGGREQSDAKLFVVNNTAVSDMRTGILLQNHSNSVAVVANNIFLGGQSLSEGPSRLAANLTGGDAGLVDANGFDYRLAPGSPAIDAGDESIAADGVSLIPDVQYVEPLQLEPRPRDGAVDIGAYEAAR